jgi:hypothetical protein
MALQVTGGVGCCCPRPLPGSGGRRLAQAAALCRPPRAVASGATTVVEEDEGKVRLGGSSVAVTKLGIGAWSWGDTTYWNDSEWDGTWEFTSCCAQRAVVVPVLVLILARGCGRQRFLKSWPCFPCAQSARCIASNESYVHVACVTCTHDVST